MKIKTQCLINALNMASVFNDNICIMPREGKWHIALMDIANVSLISIDIPMDCTGFEDEIFVSCGKLTPILKLMDAECDISIDGGRMTIKSGKLSRRVNLLTGADVRVPNRMPNVDFTAGVTLSSDELKTAIKSIGDVGDSVDLRFGENAFCMYCEDERGTSANYTIDKGELKNSYGVAKVKIPLSYIVKFVSQVSKNTDIQIESADYAPVKISGSGDMDFVWFCAPWTEQE